MIYYIASFPRSGNTWTRNLIKNQFGRITSPSHMPQTNEYLIDMCLSNDSDNFLYSHLILNPHNTAMNPDLIYYQPKDNNNVQYCSIIPGCQFILQDEKKRKYFAEMEEKLFVKTHDFPFDRYFPGEFVIQPIRNPGACYWSYKFFLHDIREKDISLEELLLGLSTRQHWNKYHIAWQKTEEALSNCYLSFHYEKMFNENAICQQLKSFIGLPMLNSDFKPFKYYHHRKPKHARQGKPHVWRENYTRLQLELLWLEHGEMMEYHGYQNPLNQSERTKVFPISNIERRKQDPVFITARFRTGSTMLWNLFHHIPNSTAFYEPLHEQLQLFIRFNPEPQSEHFHVDTYFDEYKSNYIAKELYDESFGLSKLYLESGDKHPSLKKYIAVLIDSVDFEQTAVLKFNRIDFRLQWIKKNFPQAKILHLYRTPRDEWLSSLIHYEEDPDSEINANPLLISTWSQDLSDKFPFLATHNIRHPYQRFYYLWRLSFIAGKHQADWSIQYEDILREPEKWIPDILRFSNLLTPENVKIALELIEKKPQRKWHQEKPNEWFDVLEQECDTTLTTLGLMDNFGRKPLEEIIAASSEYQNLLNNPDNIKWTLQYNNKRTLRYQNELLEKEQVIQEFIGELKKLREDKIQLKQAVINYLEIQEITQIEAEKQIAEFTDYIATLENQLEQMREKIELNKQTINQNEKKLLSDAENFKFEKTKFRKVIDELNQSLVDKERVIQDLLVYRHSSLRYWLSERLYIPFYQHVILRIYASIKRTFLIKLLVLIRTFSFRCWTKKYFVPFLWRKPFIRKSIEKLARVRRKFLPKLFSLTQYKPHIIRLPKRYQKQIHINPKITYPTISIVTPSFNQAEFIERTLKSVIGQKYPSLEYIIQDGGSTDGTTNILEQYQAQLSSCISSPDNGQANAINSGFNKSTGEIMAYLNSDDILLPGSLAFVGQYFNIHPEIDVLYSNRIIIDQNDMEIGQWILPDYNSDAIKYADYIPQETLFWRRSTWEKAGGEIDESFHFALDWDMILRFQKSGAVFKRVSRPLAAFRVHPAQKTNVHINEIGNIEMKRIREKYVGHDVSPEEINQHLRPYIKRAIWCQIFFYLGLLD